MPEPGEDSLSSAPELRRAQLEKRLSALSQTTRIKSHIPRYTAALHVVEQMEEAWKTKTGPALCRRIKNNRVVLGLASIGLVLILLVLRKMEIEWTWEYWGERRLGLNGEITVGFNRSEIFRNFGLAALALIGLGLAIWRSILAHRAHKLSEAGLIIDRFQKGAAMLESEELSVRLAGIYALRDLALSDPDETYITVQDLLCDFIREKSSSRKEDTDPPPTTEDSTTYGPVPPDQQKAVETFSWLRSRVPNANELEEDWSAKLDGANFSGANLAMINLSGASLTRANLSNAYLWQANLSDTFLYEVNLTHANLMSANFSGSSLQDVDLTGAQLWFSDLSNSSFRRVNLTGTEIMSIELITNIRLRAIWTWEHRPPKKIPRKLAGYISIRKKDEDWDTFVERMIKRWPSWGWDKQDKAASPD